MAPWLAGVLTVLLSAGLAFARAADDAIDFRSVLRDAGVADDDFVLFEQWDGVFTEEQGNLIAKVLYRLQWLERSQGHLVKQGEPLTDQAALNEISHKAPGQLVTVDGLAVSSSLVSLPRSLSAAIDRTSLPLTVVSLASGDRAAILSKDIPVGWSERRGELQEPIEFVGVVLGSTDIGGSRMPLLLASRFKWRPTANVPVGTVWLVEQGFDAALLDDVRHGQPFAKPGESREAQAFYDCLSIMARTDAAALRGLVERALPDRAKAAEAEAAEARHELEVLSAKQGSTDPAGRAKLKGELQDARRRQAIAVGVASQGERGLSSVAPLFLDPQAYTGEAVLLEGTARRAVRIVVDEDAAGSAPATANRQPDAALPIKEYYELDLFTKDSQHLPVICCVPRLPAGFPTGEVIREPVRVTGVFFKKWAYARRTTDEPATRGRALPARLQSPLIIATTPEWLPSAPPTADKSRGLVGGLGFVATILIVWAFVARASRSDRMARRRRARYDSPLEKIAEP